MSGRIKVVYVAGSGRSGSTLLDIILGNQTQVASLGELREWPKRALSKTAFCSCGQELNECEFWGAVLERWIEYGRESDLSVLLKLQSHYEHVRAWPNLLAERVRKSRKFRLYSELTQRLYRTIHEISGEGIVVDSSKYPTPGLALTMMPEIDLRVVHLVRDGRAVMWSVSRLPNRPGEQENNIAPPNQSDRVRREVLNWLSVNLACEPLVTLLGDKAIRVRYEDLVTSPATVLGRIGELADFDTTALAIALTKGQSLLAGHTVGGNRMRLQKEIRLRPDLEWHEKLPQADRRYFWQRAGWLAGRYGYTNH